MNWAHIRMRTKRPISPGIEGQVGSTVASKTSKSGKEDSEGATAAPFARKAQAFVNRDLCRHDHHCDGQSSRPNSGALITAVTESEADFRLADRSPIPSSYRLPVDRSISVIIPYET